MKKDNSARVYAVPYIMHHVVLFFIDWYLIWMFLLGYICFSLVLQLYSFYFETYFSVCLVFYCLHTSFSGTCTNFSKGTGHLLLRFVLWVEQIEVKTLKYVFGMAGWCLCRCRQQLPSVGSSWISVQKTVMCQLAWCLLQLLWCFSLGPHWILKRLQCVTGEAWLVFCAFSPAKCYA